MVNKVFGAYGGFITISSIFLNLIELQCSLLLTVFGLDLDYQFQLCVSGILVFCWKKGFALYAEKSIFMIQSKTYLNERGDTISLSYRRSNHLFVLIIYWSILLPFNNLLRLFRAPMCNRWAPGAWTESSVAHQDSHSIHFLVFSSRIRFPF